MAELSTMKLVTKAIQAVLIIYFQLSIGIPGQVGLAAEVVAVDMELDTGLASVLNLQTVFKLVLVPIRNMAFATHSLACRVKSMIINRQSLFIRSV